MLNEKQTQLLATSSLDSLVSLPEFAKRLGKSNRTIFRWHTLRKGPRRTKIGRSSYFLEADIARWVEAQREAQT